MLLPSLSFFLGLSLSLYHSLQTFPHLLPLSHSQFFRMQRCLSVFLPLYVSPAESSSLPLSKSSFLTSANPCFLAFSVLSLLPFSFLVPNFPSVAHSGDASWQRRLTQNVVDDVKRRFKRRRRRRRASKQRLLILTLTKKSEIRYRSAFESFRSDFSDFSTENEN